MNKWFYRAVGAVGVAGGVMLLGNGVAHAEGFAEAKTADPQAMRGLVADLFSPTGGLHDLGLSLDTPDTRLSAGLVSDGPLAVTRGNGKVGLTAHAPGIQDISLAGKLPRLSDALPRTNLLSSATSLLTGSAKEEALPLPGLDSVTGMLSGGPLGGLLGGTPGGSPISGLSNGPLGGLANGLVGADGNGTIGGLTNGLLGGDASPLGSLGGLTGGDASPLSGITDGLGGLTGGLNGKRAPSPLDSLTGALPGGLAGERNDLQAPPPQDAPAPRTAGDITQDRFGDWLDAPVGEPVDQLMQQAVLDPMLDMDGLDPSDSQGVTLDPALSQQVADATSQIVPALIADAMGRSSDIGDLLAATDTADGAAQAADADLPAAGMTEGLPFVDKLPILGDVLGNGGPLDGILVVGDIAKQLPGVRDVVNGQLSLDTVTKLPLVGGMLSSGIVQGGKPGSALPIVGSVPIVGDALSKVTGNLSGLNPGRGANLLNPAPGLATQQPAAQQFAAPTVVAQPHVGRHRATERPIAGEDAEYAESAPAAEALPLPGLGELPLLGSLTGGAGGGLPLGGLLGQLPLINDLPIVGNMATSMEVLRALPLVGTAAGLLPLESDTVA
ncbi:hypothetical protein [Catellatospora sp. NPDC049609]|uniref:hypothetical protein n=1 Tax=Catellatospora sp. NPDC049609 TaxID=3155505 RepID=UPI00343D625C